MKVDFNFDVDVPMSDKEDVNLIYKFIEGDYKNVKITYADEKEAAARASVLRSMNSRKKLGLLFKRIGKDLFVEK